MNRKEFMDMKMDNRYRRDHEMAYFSDENVMAEQLVVKKAIREYNTVMPFEVEKGMQCLDRTGMKHGKNVYFEPPFHCEYGSHIELGENFYANTGCIMLDVAKITIGKNVLFGPNVSIYTAGHPVHPVTRNSAYEYGREVTIGDNVWLGGNTVICPGVHIGDNVVIGAGSVVTKDIPDWSIAAGNPCRVIRKITDADKRKLFRDEEIDDEAWADICERMEF